MVSALCGRRKIIEIAVLLCTAFNFLKFQNILALGDQVWPKLQIGTSYVIVRCRGIWYTNNGDKLSEPPRTWRLFNGQSKSFRQLSIWTPEFLSINNWFKANWTSSEAIISHTSSEGSKLRIRAWNFISPTYILFNLDWSFTSTKNIFGLCLCLDGLNMTASVLF